VSFVVSGWGIAAAVAKARRTSAGTGAGAVRALIERPVR
jgi:hypothetical protein